MNRQWRVGLTLLAAVVLVVIGSWQAWPWYSTSLTLLALMTYSLLEMYEAAAADPRRIAFVATMSAVAAVGRTAVQGIPGLQPATFLVILSGYSFGPVTGAAVGAFTALGSNLFLGEGGWTPWQMLAWGLAGATAGWLRKVVPAYSSAVLVPFGFVWGYVFGWIMNTWSWLSAGAITLHAYLALCGLSVWFDTTHALATGVLLAVAGNVVFRVLERYRRRMTIVREETSPLG